jgi:cytoskeletal protein RodZ
MPFIKRDLKVHTIGGLLKKNRLLLNLDLNEVARKINISSQYLEYLEEDDFYKMPSPTYTRGFLKRYAEFLGLNQEEIIRQWELKSKFSQNRNPIESLKSKKKKIKFNLRTAVICFVIFLFLFYLGWGIKKVLFPPKIEVFNLNKESVSEEQMLIIKGKTESGAEVFINNQLIERINNGYFEERVELLNGLNVIQISAKKKYSQPRTLEFRVVFTK